MSSSDKSCKTDKKTSSKCCNCGRYLGPGHIKDRSCILCTDKSLNGTLVSTRIVCDCGSNITGEVYSCQNECISQVMFKLLKENTDLKHKNTELCTQISSLTNTCSQLEIENGELERQFGRQPVKDDPSATLSMSPFLSPTPASSSSHSSPESPSKVGNNYFNPLGRLISCEKCRRIVRRIHPHNICETCKD